MIADFRLLFSHGFSPRIWFFGAFGIAAVLIGFVVVSPAAAGQLITHGGYYYILGLFTAFVIYAVRVAEPRRDKIKNWLRRPGWIAVAILAGAAFALLSDSFAHKVLFDEYVLQGTAWHLHATKEVGTPIRAYEFAGTWLTVDQFLDKRPYFFTFLLSLLHDLTGFRVQNVYFLNSALAAMTLGLVAWIVHALTRCTAAAALSVGLLATLPVFGQNATGASMELHNLAMIAAVMACSILYLRAPDADRLALLVFAAVLLAQCRYESVIFVVPVALIIVLGWIRVGRMLLPWPALIAPLLLIPYAWHDRFVAANPILWQLREGETARFGWEYVAGNLSAAGTFFFSISRAQPSSLGLTLLGLAALVWAGVQITRRLRSGGAGEPIGPALIVVGLFGLGAVANLALLMFYYWSRLDDGPTARFSLPFYLILALLAGWLVLSGEKRRIPALRLGTIVWAGWMLTIGAPVFARRIYTEHNLVMHEVHWELEQMTAQKGPLLVITSKATMPFLLHRIPAINVTAARTRGAQIAWHLEQGTFQNIVVAQVLRPTSADGELGVDPEDELPENFRLEPLTRKRFGARWIQLSQLVRVDPTAVVSLTGQ